MKSNQSFAYFMAVGKSIIYGSSILFTGTLLKTTDVMDVLALRFLIAALAFLLLVGVGAIHVNFRGKPLKIIIATAIFEPVFYFLFETLGLERTTTSLAGIMTAVLPVVIVLCETLFLRERTTITQKVLLMVSISGAILVTVFSGNNEGTNSLLGILFLFLAYTSGALFMIFSRKSSSDFSAVEVTFFTTMVGAVVFNGINITRHLTAGTITSYFAPLLTWENLMGFLFLSLLSSIGATVMNNYAVSRIQASSVSALGGISTITTIMLGVLVNGEVLDWYHYAGIVMILCGGIGVNYITQRRLEK